MALSRTGVYCTEPYRVPLAGKALGPSHLTSPGSDPFPDAHWQLTHCLFDKTGTLTTDTLVPVGSQSPVLLAHTSVSCCLISSSPECA